MAEIDILKGFLFFYARLCPHDVVPFAKVIDVLDAVVSESPIVGDVMMIGSYVVAKSCVRLSAIVGGSDLPLDRKIELLKIVDVARQRATYMSVGDFVTDVDAVLQQFNLRDRK